MGTYEDRPAPFPTYLLVYDVRTGEEHFKEIGEDTPLDMNALISEWVKERFCGEAEVDFPLCDHGDFEADIKTDSASPDSANCRESCCFYLK